MGSHHVPHSFVAIFKEIWPRQGHRPTEHKALADSRPKCGNIAVKPAQSFPGKFQTARDVRPVHVLTHSYYANSRYKHSMIWYCNKL